MIKNFRPQLHQNIIIKHIAKVVRVAVWCFMGGGKTGSVLLALVWLSLVEDVFPVLIIAPLRVAQSTWPNEVKKWADFQHLKVSVITGDVSERTRALVTKADIYTINQENVIWLIEKLNGAWPFLTLVVDESSRLAGFRLRQGTKRTQALSKVAFRSLRMIQLTGTPASNSLAQLWGQLWFLDQGYRLGKSFSAFSNRWFKQSYDGFSITPLPNAQKEIEEKIKDVCLSIRAEDYFPTEAPIKTIVPVKFSSHTQRQYKELEKQLFLDLGKHKIEALSAAAKTQKCLQFTAGALYVDDKRTYVEVHDEKLKALESIIEEANGMPVLVVYNFVSDLERLKKRFPKGRVYDDNPKTEKDWNKGKISPMFIHPASGGHGTNLQDGSNILVFYSIDWNLENHKQVTERLGPVRQKQSGHDRSVFLYYILVENTIDYLVMDRLETKRSVEEILLEAMARK